MTSSFSSPSFTREWTYDVFLSFRCEDTRRGFTGYLYKALCDRGMHTFIDDEELQRGEQITPSLVKAIEESRIAIPVFSENYASSTFCLDELAKIIDCVDGKGRLILPVFYDVDPSDVRHQRGTYGEALAMHEERYKANNKDKVQKWKMALQQASNLSGWHFKHGRDAYEYEFIEKIVEEVSRTIDPAPLHVADHPVGLESQVLEVYWLLDARSGDGVHMVGIHGIGGIGKTTLARAVCNFIANQFDGFCFLHDVRQNSLKHGLVHLQEKLLSQLVGDKDIKLATVSKGISTIKHRLCRKKVLLILDDVDNLFQLRAIVGGSDWFGSGSRVIITTRDKHLLASHGVERTYEVEELNETEALELLSWNAFKTNKVHPSFVDKLNSAIAYASGLPLALEVIGSNLFGKGIEEWESVLDQYERIPNKDIQNILKVTFDALDDDVKSIFLDIASFFNGYELARVEDTLRAHHGDCMKYHIGVLLEKSLIKITQFGDVTLHDLIEDMGREIVRQESPKDPGKRSRLWFPKDIVRVLEENTGTSEIQFIKLDFSKSEVVVEWDGEAFKKMNNLRVLIIRKGLFSRGPKHLPNSLRVLEWWGYPSHSLPSDFHPNKLSIFKLPFSCSMSLELDNLLKKFMNLRVLNLYECEFITQIPDVSGVPCLEELSFAYCENLIKIHESVGFLGKLRIIDAEGCSKLGSFPPINLICLEQLRLSNCLSLESFPEILGEMENLTQLSLEYTAIKELPFSIQNLNRLRKLELHSCGMLQLPSSIVMLSELEELSVWQCEGLRSSKQDNDEEKVSSIVHSNAKYLDFLACNISDEFIRIGIAWFANVKELDLSSNNFTILPPCIKDCQFLRKLNLDYCMHLQEIRGIPPKLETFSAKCCTSLKDLDLSALVSTKECCFLREIILDDCENLREIRGIPPNIELLFARNCRSLTSSCSSMLLNQELHEAGNKRFCLPGRRIPEWFEHCSRGQTISFWFRNKFPVISLCHVGLVHKHPIGFGPIVIINGNKMKTEFLTKERFHFEFPLVIDHVLIFGTREIKLEDNLDEVLLQNEWNHVVVSIDIDFKWDPTELVVMRTGLHVIKQESSMDDIRFTNPYNYPFLKEKHRLVDIEASHRQFFQQQKNLASLDLLEQHLGQGREFLSLVPPPALKSLNDDVNWDSTLMVSLWMSSTTNVQDQAFLDHPEKDSGESSQASGFDETQNIQASTLSPTSSSGKVGGEELHLNACCTVLPTTIDECLRNQIELSQDDVEMEAFYASLDAGTCVLSCSHDKLATTASRKDAMEALKIVQDFVSNDASVLLHLEQCSVMKTSLDFLSNLSVNDGISREMRTLILEASSKFTYWRRDYIEATMKIESTASELQRVDELEARLAANKNQFGEVLALENELLQKLASVEKSIKELGEKINAIKANISASESEKNMARQRKKDIFEEGKTLKIQMDELREKVPHLLNEQSLAKETQEKITAEWSKLGEKFKRLL